MARNLPAVRKALMEAMDYAVKKFNPRVDLVGTMSSSEVTAAWKNTSKKPTAKAWPAER
jgi:hypothetical protein